MGLQDEFLLCFGSLKQLIGRPVGLDANKDAYPFGLGQRGVELVEAADEEVAHETIKESCVAAQQNAKAVAKVLALLVRDEREVGGHAEHWSSHGFTLLHDFDEPRPALCPRGRLIVERQGTSRA